ncbi:MAG: TIGR01777 family protein [Opitutae bacterium]|nr:TIGR01777 family protein [Opitutae bacterium]
MSPKAVLAGGSGFLGQALARELRSRGREVVVLTRRPRARRGDGIREVAWDPAAAGPGNPRGCSAPGAWARELEGAEAVVNFTGRSVNCVHHAENRRAILATRLESVRALGAAVQACRQPPAVWVQCSATGYYGDVRGRLSDERAPAGRGFMAEVCREWEHTFEQHVLPATRKVTLRLGVVLGKRGGAYPPLARLTRWFLGGTAGRGDQGVSWIHIDDVTALFLAAMESSDWRGVYNACAPEPATNAEFMRTLREVQKRPWAPPAPGFAVRLTARWLLRTDGDLILAGPRCVPARAMAAGFRFKFAKLLYALDELAER